MALMGVDVSNYQGEVDWVRVRRSGHVFAACKATEGLSFTDPTFPTHWLGARPYIPVRMAYHFLHPAYDGRSQADFHHAYVHHSGGYLKGEAVVLDVEATDNRTSDAIIQCIEDFVTRALAVIHKQVIIYTGKYFWEELGNPQVPILRKRPLWDASYSTELPTPYGGWSNVSFWQYSDTGSVPGISGNADLDQFFGTLEQLKKVCAYPL